MIRFRYGWTWLLLLTAGWSAPAAAQIAVSVAAQNDLRYRARSLSEGDPVVSATLSYEDSSGVYGGAGATLRLGDGEDGPGLLGQQLFGGYAYRLSPKTSIDTGVNFYRYTALYSGQVRTDYAEIYAGVTHDNAALYISYTPDYFGNSLPVVHVSASYARTIATDWTVSANAGVLLQTSGPARLEGRSIRYDASIGISRSFGRLTLSADATLGGPDDAYYAGPWRGNSALVLSARRSF
jgi:uncharacterized protein (TIGR02001 family)